MKFRPYLIAFSVVFGAWAAVPSIAAQGDQARLTGRVTDESGAALPGATVMVTSEKIIEADCRGDRQRRPVQDTTARAGHLRGVVRDAWVREPERIRRWCSARARSSCSTGSSDWRSSPRR